MKNNLLNEISIAVKTFQAKLVKSLVEQALSNNISPTKIIEEGLLPPVYEVSNKIMDGKSNIAEVLIISRTAKAGLSFLGKELDSNSPDNGKNVVLGTVYNDLHDIGKDLVKLSLSTNGFYVIDLGVNVPAEKFIEAAKQYDAKVIACSALLTNTLPEMRNIVRLTRQHLPEVKIMIGGSPVNEDFKDLISADYYSNDLKEMVQFVLSVYQNK